ncbi:MAG TPA: hypothetical protein VEQ37_10415 [Actinomycetota bacterium]|nr:hypothetical protein [Actinomycetota bacterium]
MHVHLEGSIRMATLRELAARHQVPLPSGLVEESPGIRDVRASLRFGRRCPGRPRSGRHPRVVCR